MNEELKLMGQRLKHQRKQRGLTQKDLSERLIVGKDTVSQYERGRLSASGRVLIMLARHGFDIADLFADIKAEAQREQSLDDLAADLRRVLMAIEDYSKRGGRNE